MTTITYKYTYRGEEKSRTESIDRVLDIMQHGATAGWDPEKQPKAVFAYGRGGAYTGLIAIEFLLEGIGRDEYAQALAAIHMLPHALMTFADNRRETLAVVTAYTLPDGSLPQDGEQVRLFHDEAYLRESQYLKHMLGMELLLDTEGIGHAMALPACKDAWLNDAVRPMQLEQPAMPMPEDVRRRLVDTATQPRYDVSSFRLLPGYDEYSMMMADYQKCLGDILAEGHADMDMMLTALAERCMECGISEEFAVKRLVFSRRFRNYEVLVRSCFSNVYAAKRTTRGKAIGKAQVVSNMLMDYLSNRYRFRRNEMTGSLEYREDGMYIFDWQPVTRYVANTITIEAQRLGIPVWDKDVKRMLESNFVQQYNPLTDYLLRVRDRWDGQDRIEALARRVPNGNARWPELFHRWMLSVVAQWTGANRDYASTVVPLLVGAQGDGKSTFCRFLLPPELRGFYTDRLDFANKKEAERALSAFALINIDEYDSISPSQTAFLKHVLQKTNVMGRDPYAMAYSDHKRYAAFIATTNAPMPLTDPTGSRRYLCIRTTGRIDNAEPIDYEQVYGQLATELYNRERCYFDSADEAYIQQCNSEFQAIDTLEEALTACFARPDEDGQGKWMLTVDIAERISSRFKFIEPTRSTMVRIGLILGRLGFASKKTCSGKLFLVSEMI